MANNQSKSFWQRPEGVTGIIFILALLVGGGMLVAGSLTAIMSFLGTTVGLVITLGVLGLLIFMILDKKSRTLVSYMYKSVMRAITGLFIKLDPIAILKSYVQDLKDNLKKMNRQIVQLRGQMHKLKEMIINNKKEISANLNQASIAKEANANAQVILKSRKAGRLKESNVKLEDLYKKMEILYRVLTKMQENSAILVEDIEDQVTVKEQERKALLAGHSAMKSAMNILKGDPDKRAMFDAALEAVADDVNQKAGEMERFIETSENFMQSVDLQNGVFEEEGLKMLEKWESESDSLLLGGEKPLIISKANDEDDVLDLSQPIKTPEKQGRGNQYDHLFD